MTDGGGVSSPRTLASPLTVPNSAIGTARAVSAVGTIGSAAAAPKKKFARPTMRRRRRRRRRRQRTHARDAVKQSTRLGVWGGLFAQRKISTDLNQLCTTPSNAHHQTCDRKLARIAWLRTSFCKGGLDVGVCRELWAVGPQQVASLGAVNYRIRQVHRPACRHPNTVGGSIFRHQARHRSCQGPAEIRPPRVLPGAGCRNFKACGTCDYKCGYGCVLWHTGFKHPCQHVRKP
eukprot:355280-Chlamydomonas_euryale.AAC.8